MQLETDCVPMKWPSGPLELALRERKGPVSPELRETLRAWHQPAALEWLRGTVVDCLIVTWASGLPQDEEQQDSLKPLIERGRRAGIQFIGWVDEAADIAFAAAKARASGLSAMASARKIEGRSEVPIIQVATRPQARWDDAGPFLIVNDAVWPQIRSNIEEGKDHVDAGPTGIPWVNSNGWYVRLAKALSPEKTVWLAVDPSKESRSSYLVVMADARAFGAHWVIS